MNEFFREGWGKWALVALTVFIGLQALTSLVGLRYIGAGLPATNTITVSGYGETSSAPTLATFTYAVVSLRATVAAAQEDAAGKANAVTAYLKDAGVADKDIQTSNYSVYPEYEYQQVTCITYPCDGRQVLKGYRVSQSTTVKVRDLAAAGDILAGVGERGATEVSGLEFTYDDPRQGQNEARGKAIADAKAQAFALAKQLGVRLVRVVAFSESGGYPTPYAYGVGGAADSSVKASAPVISPGENKTTSSVTITYEIR